MFAGICFGYDIGVVPNYNTKCWCHIDRMGDISYIVLEILWQCLFVATHTVQITSALRVAYCYKHRRTELSSLRSVGMTCPLGLCYIVIFAYGILLRWCLHDSLCHHCTCNLEEAGYVSTLHIVDVSVLACTVLDACAVDVVHDLVQHLINLCAAPVDLA